MVRALAWGPQLQRVGVLVVEHEQERSLAQ